MTKKSQAVENEAAEATEAAEAPEAVITLTEICAEMGIKTTSARVKLRKKLAEGRKGNSRWVFPLEQKDEIVALLTPKAGEVAAAEDKGDDNGEAAE